MGAITRNGCFKRHRHYVIGIDPVVALYAMLIRILDNMAMEFNLVQHFGTRKFPGIAITQPIVGMFDLPAVLDALREHAIFITDAVTVTRKVERRHGVEEAGGQPPQAAISKCGIRLYFTYIIQSDP